MNNKMMMYLFPLMSVFFTTTSNSIFALYWIASNLCSIASYWTFDKIWAAKAKKREEEEKARQAEIEKAEAEKAAAALALKAAQPKSGKTNPKEGKNK
jgi:membrane protein insertase Oxa1/YidC/SpoIIIJ